MSGHKIGLLLHCFCAPSEVRTHDLEIMRLARCLLRYRSVKYIEVQNISEYFICFRNKISASETLKSPIIVYPAFCLQSYRAEWRSGSVLGP